MPPLASLNGPERRRLLCFKFCFLIFWLRENVGSFSTFVSSLPGLFVRVFFLSLMSTRVKGDGRSRSDSGGFGWRSVESPCGTTNRRVHVFFFKLQKVKNDFKKNEFSVFFRLGDVRAPAGRVSFFFVLLFFFFRSILKKKRRTNRKKNQRKVRRRKRTRIRIWRRLERKRLKRKRKLRRKRRKRMKRTRRWRRRLGRSGRRWRRSRRRRLIRRRIRMDRRRKRNRRRV